MSKISTGQLNILHPMRSSLTPSFCHSLACRLAQNLPDRQAILGCLENRCSHPFRGLLSGRDNPCCRQRWTGPVHPETEERGCYSWRFSGCRHGGHVGKVSHRRSSRSEVTVTTLGALEAIPTGSAFRALKKRSKVGLIGTFNSRVSVSYLAAAAARVTRETLWALHTLPTLQKETELFYDSFTAAKTIVRKSQQKFLTFRSSS